MPNPTPQERLLQLRSTIDNIDAALVHILAERFKATQRVGRLKAERGLPPSDPAREASQIERLRALAVDAQGLLVSGRLERADGVTHVRAHRLRRLPVAGRTRSRDFH